MEYFYMPVKHQVYIFVNIFVNAFVVVIQSLPGAYPEGGLRVDPGTVAQGQSLK